nr:Protein F02E9.5, isoform a [Haemonchus contortus]
MASEDFSLDIASTSEGSTADVVLDKAMKILECLVIDWKSKRSLESDSGNLSKTNRTLKDAKEMECRHPTWKRQNKWTPYWVPRRDIPVACSVQAVRRPPTPDGEVDELSEYFAHFVRVDLKMSSLAESMYV